MAQAKEKSLEALTTLSSGNTKIWLDASKGYAFTGALFGGHQLTRTSDLFPSFKFVNSSGKSIVFRCDDEKVNVKVKRLKPDAISLLYAFPGAQVVVRWTVKQDLIVFQGQVLEESDLKIESIGSDYIFALQIGPKDYGISAPGYLIRPDPNGKPVVVDFSTGPRWMNALGARVGECILFLKPLTYSTTLRLRAVKEQGNDVLQFGVSLYFRPKDFINPKTKICRNELSWRIEKAGDENSDGEVDWVDCGIAYRDRYLKPNLKKNRFLRDSYLYLASPGPKGYTYENILQAVRQIDFATGLFCLQGVIKSVKGWMGCPNYLPYKAERTSIGDKTKFAQAFRQAGVRIGIYHPGGYYYYDSGDWPEELVVLDPEGKPALHVYPYYKRNTVRGVASGKIYQYYKQVFETAQLERGDPLYLDGGLGWSDWGYHPDFPSIPDDEVEAERKLAKWLKDELGFILISERMVEGCEDLVDYVIDWDGFNRPQGPYFWKTDFPRKRVLLVPLLYTGIVYRGEGWYESRKGSPNFATALVYCAKLWDWTGVFFPEMPEYLWQKTARYFFNNNIFWSLIADHKIKDIDQRGTEFTIKFEKGPDGSEPLLWADVEKRLFWVEKGGIRYDGFTPFSTRGVMAIIRQGNFDITLPVKDELEIHPSQPFREELEKMVRITRTSEGFVRVMGNFSKIKWKFPLLHGDGDTRRIDYYETEPVLLLRKRRTKHR